MVTHHDCCHVHLRTALRVLVSVLLVSLPFFLCFINGVEISAIATNLATGPWLVLSCVGASLLSVLVEVLGSRDRVTLARREVLLHTTVARDWQSFDTMLDGYSDDEG